MTIVKENFMTTGLSGKYDDKVVFRQWKGRTIFAKPPRKQEKPTANQLSRKEIFLKAVDYASVALTDPALKEAYRKMAPLGLTAYNMAIADYLKSPTIHSIDNGGYSGEAGGLITVVAEDNCRVKSVTVRIALADGAVIEEGAAVQIGGGRVWIYTTTANNSGLAGSVITAIATDVPNHHTIATLAL